MDMLPFTIKIFFTSIFININNNVFSVIFGKFYSVEQVGIYTQGQKWASMGNQFIAGMTNSVAQPILVHVNEVKERQVSVLRKLIRFNALLSFPLILGLAFVGKEFIVITVGEKWLSSVPYLQLFCIWGAFSFLSALYTNLIFTHGKSNVYMYGSIVTGVLQLLVVFGMYPFGIFPMVIAYLTVNFVGVLIWQYFVHKLVGLRFLAVLKDIVPYLSVTLCCFAVAWFLTRNIANLYWLFTAKIVISGLLYLLILKLTDSVMFKESMEFLMKSTKK
ncbi:hypothetical protein AGMMS49525_01370 [Bacteroidia bacterium]|nr:hypothetical protein AGMMS49525_01370 [Bacteroidia bacterium]